MINKIIDILKSEGVEKYLINQTISSSCELFFIKKKLDTRRLKDVTVYEVTVYRDFEKDGNKLRGSAGTTVFPTMTDEEIRECIKSAYFAAQYAGNPYYELVQGDFTQVKDESVKLESVEEAVLKMEKALYSVDNDSEAFINSAEFFAVNEQNRIVNSDGVDVSFNSFNVNGEFVTQCKTEEDVELHYSFKYDKADEKAIAEKAAEGIKAAKDRSVAKRVLKSGTYDVILSGEELAEVLSYYTDRANAQYIYMKYSDYAAGTELQGCDVKGEKLNITCMVTSPYSIEGIKMTEHKLAENGVLKSIEGTNRFAQYLGVPATGIHEKIKLDAGTQSLDEMKRTPYLYAVKFSDFQMDFLTGHFGGEIRLAYLYDGENVSVITGGSINGVITNVHNNLVFSTEKYSDSSYEGPFAVKIENVAVAGSN